MNETQNTFSRTRGIGAVTEFVQNKIQANISLFVVIVVFLI